MSGPRDTTEIFLTPHADYRVIQEGLECPKCGLDTVAQVEVEVSGITDTGVVPIGDMIVFFCGFCEVDPTRAG